MGLRDWVAKKIASKPKVQEQIGQSEAPETSTVPPVQETTSSVPPVQERIRVPAEEEDYQRRVDELQAIFETNLRLQVDPSDPQKIIKRDLSPTEKVQVKLRAQKVAGDEEDYVKTLLEAQSEAWKQGIEPIATEYKRGGYNKATKTWSYIPLHKKLSPAEQKLMAEKIQREMEESKLQRQRVAGATKLESRLEPIAIEAAEVETKESLEQLKRQRQLSPMYSQIEKGNLESVLYQQKKEAFGRTKRGRALNLTGRAIEKTAGAAASGLGNASAGMGMAILAQPRTGTQYITGRYDTRAMQLYTPRPLPVGGQLAGSGMNPGMSPAGMALIPNLKNLNPAIVVNPVRPVQKQQTRQSLSPLPRRRQQQQPGASRIG